MSFILFLMMNFLYFFIYEINRKKLIIFFTSIIIVFSIMISDKNLRNQYLSFFDNSKFLVTNFNKFVVKDTTKEEKQNPDYKQHGSSHKYLLKLVFKYGKKINFLALGLNLSELNVMKYMREVCTVPALIILITIILNFYQKLDCLECFHLWY